ncbi:hypothetical protein BIW11_11540 [Tropilaelaps mercedesae]|uniref:Uncharacterized protein n=1 Tax=Tropilaelaps mercedesae TaxID=418985 RepID=A0A1V9XB75_9ACAR|nr:hypothetical protein BIW11_11540 [Tropilaelaps mercedesae]
MNDCNLSRPTVYNNNQYEVLCEFQKSVTIALVVTVGVGLEPVVAVVLFVGTAQAGYYAGGPRSDVENGDVKGGGHGGSGHGGVRGGGHGGGHGGGYQAYVIEAVKEATIHHTPAQKSHSQQKQSFGGWPPAPAPQSSFGGGGWEQAASPPQKNYGGNGGWQQSPAPAPAKSQGLGGQRAKVYVVQDVKEATIQHVPRQSVASKQSFGGQASSGWAPAPQKSHGGGGGQGWQQGPAQASKNHGAGFGGQQARILVVQDVKEATIQYGGGHVGAAVGHGGGGGGWQQAPTPQKSHGGSTQQGKVYVVQDVREATIQTAPSGSLGKSGGHGSGHGGGSGGGWRSGGGASSGGGSGGFGW